ncbi:glycosyltransferase [Dictyobacter arantiisoli]|nr:glycosyltransferase [Dictyobacter arantiisoli]
MIQEKTQQNNLITQLALPRPTYVSVQIQDGNLQIAESVDNTVVTYHKALHDTAPDEAVITWLKQATNEHNLQFIAASLREGDFTPELPSKLWLLGDIVPYWTPKNTGDYVSPEERVKTIQRRFDQDNLVNVPLTPEREVVVSELVSLEDYRATVMPDQFELLEQFAQKFSGKRLVFINATPQGGGVALMRHALIRLLRLLGVDAHWHILLPCKEVFDVTKSKIHNVLQNVAAPSVELNEEDKQLYREWTQENANVLAPVFQQADVIVVDDPQPAGLIPHIRQINPAASVLYRSHIQIEAELATCEGTPQATTWNFLWDFIQQADLFISHPMKMFVPNNIPTNKILYMPATTDALDGLNKPLTEQQMETYLKLLDQLLIEDGQKPLDARRPYIAQIARFDPSKGIPDVLDAYRQLREILAEKQQPMPQLVIAGNSSIDDPDGVPIFSLIKRMLQTKPYAAFADDIKVVRLPHRDQILDTLLRKSRVVLQLSIKEGFEIKVTEALLKGKPVVAYRTGGIPLQIQDNANGFLVPVGETTQVAKHLYDLMTDEILYESMSNAATGLVNRDYLTIGNATNWLYLAVTLANGKEIEGNYQWVSALAQPNEEEAVA